MYIQRISIKNYRNFMDFTMEFSKGLNVIIGANNSGKTGLLYAVRLLNEPTLSVDDFNKNNLLKYKEYYLDEPPSIEIAYTIRHLIFESDTKDESIIRLLPFLGMDKLNETFFEESGDYQYDLTAVVKIICSLDSKALGEYKNAVTNTTDFNTYMTILKSFIPRYSWAYYNGVDDSVADKKDAAAIFDIRFISAERTNDAVSKETRREIDVFAKDPNNALSLGQFKDEISTRMRTILQPALERLSNLFENENNEIGLTRGNVSISHDLRPNVSIGEAYVTEVRDTSSDYNLPLDYNGLGYNNLINIYMLVKLTEIRKGCDFRILCLEEPEAHLHPAMQYKLFKYLKELDESDKLNQQIFVTTHSSNISAVAGIDNMYMLAYERSSGGSECRQQSLAVHFSDKIDAAIKCESLGEKDSKLKNKEQAKKKSDKQTDALKQVSLGAQDDKQKNIKDVKEKSDKQKAKEHLTKFLDVTRSDMLFADKVILVEGIAEKLLLPLFMEKCDCAYEDEHISIVEIGGKHFEHFIELFNANAVTKKVLCVTDNDFMWITKKIKVKTFTGYKVYKNNHIPHIKKLKSRFPIDNFYIVTQGIGGRTFEDELLLTNMQLDAENLDTLKNLMKIVATDTISSLLDKHGLNFTAWQTNRPTVVNSVVSKYLDAFNERMQSDSANEDFYKRLFFAELFLYYASRKKGDVALNILADDKLSKNIVVPQYIKEGLEWLLK